MKPALISLRPRGDELMEIFYANLFAVAPSVQPLFADADMARQRAMLLSALVLLRKSLRDLDAVVPTLKRLGARHVAYGARPEHYPVVGDVLIGAMAQVAGRRLGAALREGLGGGVRRRRRGDARRRARSRGWRSLPETPARAGRVSTWRTRRR